MVLGVKTRLVLAGAVLGASLMALATANAQFDPSTGAPTTTPGIPQPDLSGLNTDAGLGGSGSMIPPSTYPSPFGEDAGFGGSGFSPYSPFGGSDAGTGLGF
jgi:hypothetical protein